MEQVQGAANDPTLPVSLENIEQRLDGLSPSPLDHVNRRAHQLLNQHSRFLKLPPEIRNLLYTQVIEEHLDTLQLIHPHSKVPRNYFIPPLFGVSQEIRAEGLDLLYSAFVRVGRVFRHPNSFFDYVVLEYPRHEARMLPLRPVKTPNPYESMHRSYGMAGCLHIAEMQYGAKDLVVIYHPSDERRFYVYEDCK